MLEHSPVGGSQANGDAERAVQSVQGIARTLKEALEISIGAEVPMAHDVMTWLVEHAATILNLFKRSHGGEDDNDQDGPAKDNPARPARHRFRVG